MNYLELTICEVIMLATVTDKGQARVGRTCLQCAAY